MELGELGALIVAMAGPLVCVHVPVPGAGLLPFNVMLVPPQIVRSLPALAGSAGATTVTEIVPAVPVHPAAEVAVTEYVPAFTVPALAMDVFCTEELKLFGPLHAYDVPPETELALSDKFCPAHTGLLLEGEGATGVELIVSVIASDAAGHGPAGSLVTSESETVPETESFGPGAYVAFSVVLFGEKPPSPPDVHVAPVALPPIVPDNVYEFPLQIEASAPAFTVAGVFTVTVTVFVPVHPLLVPFTV